MDVLSVGVGAKIVVNDDLRFHRHRTFLLAGTVAGFSQHTQYPKVFRKAIDKGTEKTVPLLMIPTIEPLIRDANDWEARYETVKNTFSARTGQISNAALNRSIQAYNENSTAEDRERYRKEVEMLAILTGLEIDSFPR